MECDRQIFSHFDHFYPFYPTCNPKNQNVGRKNMPGDIIILHKCTKNHHMLYSSWDMAHDRCNCFCPLNPVAVTLTPDIVPALKKKFLDIQAN